MFVYLHSTQTLFARYLSTICTPLNTISTLPKHCCNLSLTPACDDWFYGDCSTSCPCNKLNTLTCDKESGACSCRSGWNGTDCNVDINECETDQHNCTGNHQYCNNKDGGYNCVCEAGYWFGLAGQCVGELLFRGAHLIFDWLHPLK